MFQRKRVRKYKYDMKAEGNPFKVGFFIPSQEWNIECSESQVCIFKFITIATVY